MLHLQPRVHLQKIEVPVAIDDEFHRARARVAHGLRQRHGLLAHGAAGVGVEKRARRLLDHLLVAPLDRAFALAQIDAIAMTVAEHLDLDMARLRDEFLDEDPVVAETRRRLVLRALEPLARLVVIPGDAHALAAAARARLEHHRIADLGGDLHRLIGIRDQAHRAGHRVHARLLGELLGGDLVAHRLDRRFRRADEGHARGRERLGEFRVFRQEAVAGMHRLGAARADGVHHPVDDDIALACRGRPDMHRLVGHLHMQRPGVGVRIDRHRLDAHLARGLDHPAGDLAPVRDQDLVEHLSSLPLPGPARAAPRVMPPLHRRKSRENCAAPASRRAPAAPRSSPGRTALRRA